MLRSAESTEAVQALVFKIEEMSAQAAARWAGYVLEMGASPRIVAQGTKTGVDGMNFLTPAQLRDLNVVNVED